MTQGRVFFHVGYPKCASTFLQRQIFAHAPDLNAYCPETFVPTLFCDRAASDYSAAEREAQFQQIPRRLEERYWADREKMDFSEAERACRLSAIRDAVAADPRPAMVSSESMCIGPWQDDPRYYTTDTPEHISERIRTYFPDATIILCLRPQADWIESWWRQKVNGLLTDMPQTMLERPFWRDRLLPRLRYDEVVKSYRDIFGADRVEVLFLADLYRDPAGFVARLCEMIGIAVPEWRMESRNEGRSNAYLYAKLHSNRAYLAASRALFSERFCKKQLDIRYHNLWKRYLAHGDRLLLPLSGKRVLHGERRAAIDEMFRGANTALADMLGIDLTDHGFRL